MDEEAGPAEKADVIPVQAHGMVDLEASDVSDAALMAAALRHTSESLARYERLNVKHGSEFINEYPRTLDNSKIQTTGTVENPNHLLGAFPVLFPYGFGGFEVDRERPVSYAKHAQWALQYADRRFSVDLQFVFQTFGVMVKRKICSASKVQIKQSSYSLHAKELSKLSSADFLAASIEEEQGIPISNPSVRMFRKQLTAVRAKVTGTDENRRTIRSKIWGCTLVNGPPTVWMTINPSDIHDPIAQFLVGESINLDDFNAQLGPDNATRAFNIAENPLAAAEFFHITIRAFLKEVLGISAVDLRGNNRIKRRTGILGDVEAFIGTVEAQGRGMLHLHLLLWLEDAPTSQEMTEALHEEAFRERAREWIKNNITADIGGLSVSEIEALPKKNNYSYSRPLRPDNPDYVTLREEELQKLARSLLVHVCKGHGCLSKDPSKRKCKRRAPFERAEEAWIDEDGRWGPKRIHPYVVGHNQTCLLLLRCNHDIKLLTNAYDSSGIFWYITMYATKKQQKTSNASAILARKLAFDPPNGVRDRTTDELNRSMLNRCANALSREQEFSAPEVVSYLMGWGDRYISHHYETIYWDGLVYALKRRYPGLREPS